jgi:hypothetical protein
MSDDEDVVAILHLASEGKIVAVLRRQFSGVNTGEIANVFLEVEADEVRGEACDRVPDCLSGLAGMELHAPVGHPPVSIMLALLLTA